MSRKSSYVRMGLTVFLTVCAILLFYDTLFGSRAAVIFGRQFIKRGSCRPAGCGR